MPTNDQKVNIYPKRLLGRTAIKDQFLDYLQGCIDDVATGFFAGSSGTLDQDVVGLQVGGPASTFSINTTNAQRVLAGNHVINLTAITGVDITTDIPFENSGGATYYVGVYFAEVEIGIEANARTGDPEYKAWKQTFGDKANPDAVTDGLTYIRLQLDGLCGEAVSHAGRKVRVWMVDPCTMNESIGFFDGTISWGGGMNYVDIPYAGANGPLGQDTSGGPPSTTTTDYMCFVEGVSWRKTVDLRLDTSCAYLGRITGGVPPTFNTTDQQLLQIVSLDRAYDGVPGPGAGRAIYVDSGAVDIKSPGSTGDLRRSQLRLDKSGDAGYYQVSLELVPSNSSQVPIAILQALKPGSGVLQENETCNTNVDGQTIDFTRVGVDLRDANLALNKNVHLVLITAGVMTGLFAISSFTSTSIVCTSITTGGAPGWAAGAATVTVLEPRMIAGGSTLPINAGCSALGLWRGLYLAASDGQRNPHAALTINPEACGTLAMQILDSFYDAAAFKADPKPAVGYYDNAADGGYLILGQRWAADHHTRVGLLIQPHVKGMGAADYYALNVMPQVPDSGSRLPSARQVGFHTDGATPAEIMRSEPWGRMADAHRFVERFDYHHMAGMGPGNALLSGGKWYKTDVGAATAVKFNDPTASMYGHGDICNIDTGGGALNDRVTMQGSASWVIRHNLAGVFRKLNLFARARALVNNTDLQYLIGFSDSSMNDYIAFEVNTVLLATWLINSVIGGVSLASVGLQAIDATGAKTNNLGWVEFYMSVDPANNNITYWMTGMAATASMAIRPGAMLVGDWNDSRCYPLLLVKQLGAGARQLEVDQMELWDELIVAGPKE